MTLKEALIKGTGILKTVNIEAPAADAGVMLCHVFACDKAYLYAHADDTADAGRLEKYFEMTAIRSGGTPVQYVTGHQEFMSLDFEVGPGVLIPRHDTETLVEAVIARSKEFTYPLKILDIGTGSGCIAVSLAYFMKDCAVTAIDNSEKALGIACRNAVKNGVTERIEFIAGNLFNSLKQTAFDIIVSNPPYIPKADIPALQQEVRDHEPLEALDGGEDGLSFYRKIVNKASGFLKPQGLLAFETGFNQAADVVQLMKEDYADIAVLKDLAGIDRVVLGKLR